MPPSPQRSFLAAPTTNRPPQPRPQAGPGSQPQCDMLHSFPDVCPSALITALTGSRGRCVHTSMAPFSEESDTLQGPWQTIHSLMSGLSPGCFPTAPVLGERAHPTPPPSMCVHARAHQHTRVHTHSRRYPGTRSLSHTRSCTHSHTHIHSSLPPPPWVSQIPAVATCPWPM